MLGGQQQVLEAHAADAAIPRFASNLHEQVQAGKIQDAEAAAACRMLDQAKTLVKRCETRS